MKKIIALFLCLVALFVIVSCKDEPEQQEAEPKLVPATTEDILAGNAFYRLTATREAKRFALQYLDEEEGTFDPQEGDKPTFKYRTNHAVDRFYLRDSSQNPILEDGDYHAILASEDPYVSVGEDGWIAFEYTFPEMTDPRFGIRLELAVYNSAIGKFKPGYYIDIKDLEYKGEKLTIDPAGEDEEWQTNSGVWNNTNTDHTRPTLEMWML